MSTRTQIVAIIATIIYENKDWDGSFLEAVSLADERLQVAHEFLDLREKEKRNAK